MVELTVVNDEKAVVAFVMLDKCDGRVLLVVDFQIS
jgi:hypothetical protein